MKLFTNALVIIATLMLGACSPETPTSTAAREAKPAYVTLSEDLTQLKADFNAMSDKVRLVFISGPSCGICLRGMDDLNESIVASIQNDSRVHTLVVQVPALGAEEKHAAATVALMPGPRVIHYWDPNGRTGLGFQEALDIRMYAWDVWLVYEPGTRWEADAPPPAPMFWQHQLGPLPDDKRLDADEFAAFVTARLAELPDATEATRMATVERADPGLLRVAQPRGVMIGNNHRGRGGYQKLKTITAIRYEGQTDIDGQTASLTVETERPNHYARSTGEGVSIDLPVPIRDAYLGSYEFDGWMTDWKAKGHEVRRLGMKKDGDKLPWIMEAVLTNGQTWQIYVDSHNGDAYRLALISSSGEEMLALEFDNYGDVDGFRLPHEVRYFDGDRLLGTDRFQQISVEIATTINTPAGGD